ncbi:hypothetical protein BMS3Bbin01_02519 [bacterium BMS3Bbin01]|nr:hypothetical protein BMS3Bbin01_02519 [bacterium BMS3Bbin01]
MTRPASWPGTYHPESSRPLRVGGSRPLPLQPVSRGGGYAACGQPGPAVQGTITPASRRASPPVFTNPPAATSGRRLMTAFRCVERTGLSVKCRPTGLVAEASARRACRTRATRTRYHRTGRAGTSLGFAVLVGSFGLLAVGSLTLDTVRFKRRKPIARTTRARSPRGNARHVEPGSPVDSWKYSSGQPSSSSGSCRQPSASSWFRPLCGTIPLRESTDAKTVLLEPDGRTHRSDDPRPARFLLMAHLSIADAHCLSWG